MAGNIFAKARASKEIFKDERYLYPEFVPERLPHRDSEIDSLVFAFNPILHGKKPQNVFVFGSSGTGKTVTVKFVLNEMEEYSDRAKFLYVNCFEFNTRHAIVSKIANFLGQAIPRRGTATDEVYSRMLQGLKRAEFTPVIVLDEADQLMKEGEASKIFYDLLRVIENEKARLGLVFIANDSSFTAKLDDRVRSSLAAQTLEFAPYTPEQLKEILRERAQYAFLPSAIEKDVINLAAAHAAKLGGDARIAIECLWKAGKEAERNGSGKVGAEDLKKVFDSVDVIPLQKLVSSLNAEEKLLLGIIANSKELSSGELFKKYSSASKQPLTDRRLRDIVARLQALHLIVAPLTREGMRGQTRMISLNVSKESLSKLL